jgi:hypothetical protein
MTFPGRVPVLLPLRRKPGTPCRLDLDPRECEFEAPASEFERQARTCARFELVAALQVALPGSSSFENNRSSQDTTN